MTAVYSPSPSHSTSQTPRAWRRYVYAAAARLLAGLPVNADPLDMDDIRACAAELQAEEAER